MSRVRALAFMWVKNPYISTIRIYPSKPSRCIKASFYIIENRLYFLTTKGFKGEFRMKLFYVYMIIFFNLSLTSSHLHPLQVENCDSNSRLVVDDDDNCKFRLQRAKTHANLATNYAHFRFKLPSCLKEKG